jgi:uncharacterized protein YjbI with pentapeptide repeats
MANDEHVALLKKGVAAWNAWRDENPDIRPDLGNAKIGDADLSGANLRAANLCSANLSGANLRAANLCSANLSEANLSGADLSGANLGAILVDTDLAGADLTGCRIYGVSAWSLKLERSKQQNLVITKEYEATSPSITSRSRSSSTSCSRNSPRLSPICRPSLYSRCC